MSYSAAVTVVRVPMLVEVITDALFLTDLSQLQQQQHNMQESTLQYLLSSVDNMQSALSKSLEYSAPAHLQSLLRQEVVTLSHQ